MPVPDFSPGEVLTAAAMDSIGLWLVKTQTVGTGVSSVTVTGAFSAQFDNYKIIYSGGTSSGTSSVSMRLGASAASYYGFLVSGTSSSSTVNGTNRDNLDRMFYLGGSSGAGQAITLSVDVINPFASLYTRFLNGIYLEGNEFGTMQGEHRVATSYTAFDMLIATGTVTGGTIRVYGYRN